MVEVKFEPRQFPDGMGYDIVAYNPEATIGDYLRGVGNFFDDAVWNATRNQGLRLSGWKHCEGCPGCCRERIPLTAGDMVKLALTLPDIKERAAKTGSITNDDLVEAVEKFAQIDIHGRVVDISLKRDQAGWCSLFDMVSQRCQVHTSRPMVCRTYYCCPISHRAEKLRLRVVNEGEDELVRRVLSSGKAASLISKGASSADYPANAWSLHPSQPTSNLPVDMENLIRLEPFIRGLGLVRSDL